MQLNKLLIVTRADDNIKEMTDITHPIIKNFCNKWNADFYILTKPTPCPIGQYKYHYKIFEVTDLLDTYDRVLILDSDIIINKNCPNIFEIVDKNKIGSIFEDVGSRQQHRRSIIQDVQKEWGKIGWKSGYINTGVFIVSKIHKPIFQTFNGKFWTGFGYDDILLRYQSIIYDFEIQELPFQFNHMTMFSEPWNNNTSRFDSYIIHYAGNGIFDSNIKTRMDQIRKDFKTIYEK